MSIAFFAGSFNPFTLGHKSIVDRALPHFDKIIIGVGCNINKPNSLEGAKKRAEEIDNLYASEEKVEAISYNELTGDAAHKHGAEILLRGVRSCADFEYERSMAEINRRLYGLETMLIFALPQYDSISSSIVRELQSYGEDVSQFLP